MTDLRRRNAAGGLWPAVVAASVLSCGPDRRTETTVIRDSAGIRIVENSAARWRTGEGWRIADNPVIDFGDDSAVHLANVGAIASLADQRLVVQNNGASELITLDSAGAVVRRTGRSGKGPGEFAGTWGIYGCPGDSLLVNQGRQVGVYGAGGRFVGREQVAVPAGTLLTDFEVSAGSCRELLVVVQSPAGGAAHRSADDYALVWALRGHFTWDTALTFLGPELGPIVVNGREVRAPVPFGRRPVWALRDQRLYWASSEKPEARVYHRLAGLVQIFRWVTAAEPINDLDRAEYRRRRDEYLRAFPEEAIAYRPLEEYPSVARKPVVAAIHVDERSNVWIRPYPASAGGLPKINPPGVGDGPESWLVFDSAGVWLGRVNIPAGLSVMMVSATRVAGVVVDSIGGERVRAYRVDR